MVSFLYSHVLSLADAIGRGRTHEAHRLACAHACSYICRLTCATRNLHTSVIHISTSKASKSNWMSGLTDVICIGMTYRCLPLSLTQVHHDHCDLSFYIFKLIQTEGFFIEFSIILHTDKCTHPLISSFVYGHFDGHYILPRSLP